VNRRERRRAEAQQRAQKRRLRKDAQGVFVTPYLNIPDFLVESFWGLLNELAGEANQIQPPRINEFSQQAAALHDHCVVAAREGYPLKTAAISRQHDSVWLGEFWLDIDQYDSNRETLLSHLRITLAGRRGELLFTKPFCLRAGLDELAYALLIVMIPLAEDAHKDKAEMEERYIPFWGTLLAEVEETLLAHRNVVHTIADQLMQHGRLNRTQLMAAIAEIPKRDTPPPIRSLSELKLTGIAYDPLAHGSSAR
jgi:hypothetical protein